MGGNAFDTPAQRLEDAQYTALTQLILDLIRPDFVRLSVPRSVTIKQSHGDVDILCAFEGLIIGGEEECLRGEDGLQEVKPLKNAKAVVGQGAEEMRELGKSLGEKMKAIGWRRHGGELNFMLPLSILEGQSDCEGKFYQVDLVLVAPEKLDFLTFTTSYAGTSVLLGRVLKHYSRSLALHLSHLAFRHSPFFGIQPVDIIFAEDPASFCKWFGTDYEKWLEEGVRWKWEWQFWSWLTEVEDETPAAVAYKRLVRRKKRELKSEPKRNKRDVFCDKFYDWLITRSKWASVEEEDSKADPVEELGNEDSCVVKSDVPSTSKDSTPSDNTTGVPVAGDLFSVESIRHAVKSVTLSAFRSSAPDAVESGVPVTVESSSPVVESVVPSSNGKVAPLDQKSDDPSLVEGATTAAPLAPQLSYRNQPQLNIIDIDNPMPIDQGGEESLQYFGKREEYDEIFAHRKAVALPVAQSQRLKAEKKARTQALVKAQEEMIKANFEV